jgi:hypothetical protein
MNMVLTTKVVGLTFNPSYPKNIYAIAKDFALGDDSISLVREKDNEVDANAIAVHHGENQVGHVPRKLAEFISPQIDAGIEWYAAIESVVVSQNNVNNPGLKITMWSKDAD